MTIRAWPIPGLHRLRSLEPATVTAAITALLITGCVGLLAWIVVQRLSGYPGADSVASYIVAAVAAIAAWTTMRRTLTR